MGLDFNNLAPHPSTLPHTASNSSEHQVTATTQNLVGESLKPQKQELSIANVGKVQKRKQTTADWAEQMVDMRRTMAFLQDETWKEKIKNSYSNYHGCITRIHSNL